MLGTDRGEDGMIEVVAVGEWRVRLDDDPVVVAEREQLRLLKVDVQLDLVHCRHDL